MQTICPSLISSGPKTTRLHNWYFLPALLACVFLSQKIRAAGFVDGFEAYAQGALDADLTGGPNEGTNGGANPWFGGNPPNIRVVGAENGVIPHGGTNMIRGCYNCLYDKDTDWYNLSFRNAAGGVFLGNFVLDWWFYDPLGSGGGGDYVDYLALGNYVDVPPDMDYTDVTILPTPGSQRMCLGSDALRFNTDIDATMYQARIFGATEAVNPDGWFNLTNAIRSVGWHHARIVVGAANGPDTLASFYIDDMVVPALAHGTMNVDGFNILEINGDYGNTSGYFDDFTFQDNVTAPTFATGPTNVTRLAGGTAIFNVSGGNGTPSPSYSWRKDGAPVNNGGNISGANSATLTITNCAAGSAGTYSCLVSNIAGVAIATATLSVIIPPTIDSQSPPGGSITVGAGATVNFSVTAHATHTINYQWSKGGKNLNDNAHYSGTTTSNLTVSAITSSDDGSYSCHLSNADGATDSTPITLLIGNGPTISVQPTNQFVPLGSNASFTVVAAGSSLVYHWSQGATPLSNGGRISGATSNVLTINSVVDADAASYSCLITNTGGSITSSLATLTVVHLPVITTQPVSQVASNGSTVAFHVMATGTLLNYQWKKNGTSLTNGGDFTGVTTADLSIHVTSQADEGIYLATVSNPAGSVTSSSAALRLNQRSTNFFDGFESYSISSPVTYGRLGTPLDYNYGAINSASTDPWWGPSPPNFFTFPSGQDGVPAHGGNQMTGGAFSFVTSGDNDEAFLNLSYRFNGGQLYYGDVMLDWYFYDPGTPDAGDQLSLANFSGRMPANSDSSGFLIPSGPVQHLFIGTWQNLDTTKYQASVFAASDGTSGPISKNIAGNTKYFDTAVSRSMGWHHARIVVGPADAGTHVANAKFFVDDMSNAAFTHDLPPGNVGFNSIHLMACSIYTPATSETAGFFDDVTFKVVNDPYIIQQPVDQITAPGTTATFTVVAMGTSYQWKKNGGNINGATNAILTLNSVGPTDVASYTCVVSGANGSVTSSPATLTLAGGRPFLTAAQAGKDVVVTWTGAYTLLSSTTVTGPYFPVAGATSPYTNSPPLGTRFFGLGQ